MTAKTGTGRLSSLLERQTEREPLAIEGDGVRVTLELETDRFSKPDRGYGEYIARRAMREFHTDLLHADKLAATALPGSMRKIMVGDLRDQSESHDDVQLVIDGQQVMQAWEHPYMTKLADIASAAGGSVLEIGFGMGISASAIQNAGVRSHCIIECHPDVQRRFKDWRAAYPGNDITLVEGKWQDQLDGLGKFDAILFDAYPLNEREWSEHYVNDVTYANHFFHVAAQHLNPGGVFTYYSNEIDSMSRAHQRALFACFEEITLSIIDGLEPPEDCHYWQTTSFLVVEARGSRLS